MPKQKALVVLTDADKKTLAQYKFHTLVYTLNGLVTRHHQAVLETKFPSRAQARATLAPYSVRVM